jgi:para-aminobenzoate synthetase / 4-amino-4-deoxychorismate lyase
MYATHEHGVRHFQRHLTRLEASAARFSFTFNGAAFLELLAKHCLQMPPHTPHRLRVTLDRGGEFELLAAPLMPMTAMPIFALVAFEHGFAAQSSNDELLLHKTTRRDKFDHGWQTAEQLGAFDTLFFNERGEVTEGGRSNVFVRLSERWWTPPLSSGLLSGVMRAVILDDPTWDAAEKVLTLQDLLHAESLVLCNALRGILPAKILHK